MKISMTYHAKIDGFSYHISSLPLVLLLHLLGHIGKLHTRVLDNVKEDDKVDEDDDDVDDGVGDSLDDDNDNDVVMIPMPFLKADDDVGNLCCAT